MSSAAAAPRQQRRRRRKRSQRAQCRDTREQPCTEANGHNYKRPCCPGGGDDLLGRLGLFTVNTLPASFVSFSLDNWIFAVRRHHLLEGSGPNRTPTDRPLRPLRPLRLLPFVMENAERRLHSRHRQRPRRDKASLFTLQEERKEGNQIGMLPEFPGIPPPPPSFLHHWSQIHTEL